MTQLTVDSSSIDIKHLEWIPGSLNLDLVDSLVTCVLRSWSTCIHSSILTRISSSRAFLIYTGLHHVSEAKAVQVFQ